MSDEIPFNWRSLELISVISEEWGEAIKEINNYNWKTSNMDVIEKRLLLRHAIEEIKQMDSPIKELLEIIEKEIETNI